MLIFRETEQMEISNMKQYIESKEHTKSQNMQLG